MKGSEPKLQEVNLPLPPLKLEITVFQRLLKLRTSFLMKEHIALTSRLPLGIYIYTTDFESLGMRLACNPSPNPNPCLTSRARALLALRLLSCFPFVCECVYVFVRKYHVHALSYVIPLLCHYSRERSWKLLKVCRLNRPRYVKLG